MVNGCLPAIAFGDGGMIGVLRMRDMNRRNFIKSLAVAGLALSASPAMAWGGKDYYYMIAADPQLWWKEDDNKAWIKAVSVVNELKPDFLIVCGDMLALPNDPKALDMKRAEKMSKAYFGALENLDKKIPIYHAAGNHDVCQYPTKDTLAWYEERFGKPWYSFEHKKSLFIVLESNTLIRPGNVQDQAQEQMEWLEKLLKKSAKKNYRHRQVFLHHPPFVKKVDEPDAYHNMPSELRHKLLTMFEKYKVEIVFSGHLHANGYSKYGKMELISTASACHSQSHPSGLRIVHVNGDKVFDKFYNYKSMPKKLSDFSIKKKGAVSGKQ
jgi:Icc-related predicted phosphoesterase